MKNKSNGNRYADGICALLLFMLLAAGMITVILSGAGAYSRLSARDSALFNSRTCERYIATKVRGADSLSGVSVGTVEDTDALCIDEEIDGGIYQTYIWCAEGWMREAFVPAGTELSISSGERLAEADSMKLDLADGMLTAKLTVGGEERQIYINICGAERKGK